MPVHFIHISKTGGSAIKHAIRSVGEPETPYGPIHLHPHPTKLDEIPEDHHVFFSVRDPIARFVSSFYSRKRKGQPNYFRDWNEEEELAFAAFDAPQDLGAALASDDETMRSHAVAAMRGIRQVRRNMSRWLHGTRLLRRRRARIIHIVRQETLEEDWGQIKSLLGLPEDLPLPEDPVVAHRAPGSEDRRLDETARKALVDWYARDYRLLTYCEKLRRQRGWGSPGDDLPALPRLAVAEARQIAARHTPRSALARVSQIRLRR